MNQKIMIRHTYILLKQCAKLLLQRYSQTIRKKKITTVMLV